MQRELQLEEENRALLLKHQLDKEREFKERTEWLVEQEKQKLSAVSDLIEEKKRGVEVEVDAFREVEM